MFGVAAIAALLAYCGSISSLWRRWRGYSKLSDDEEK
jgi:hypothetical protein